MSKSSDSRVDVLIVGARCAGSATATFLARASLRVRVIDRAREGTDTLSTHALMRGGVRQLARLGVLDVIAARTPAVDATVFDYGDAKVRVAIESRDGVDALYAPRRTVLDPAIAAAARDAGARVDFETELVRLLEDDGRVVGAVIRSARGGEEHVHAEWVIGADGVSSSVARHTGARTVLRAHRHACVVYGHFEGLDLPAEYHWIWQPNVAAGVIPTSDGQFCVFASAKASRRREALADPERFFFEGFDGSPEHREALRGATRLGPWRPWAGRVGYLREAVGPGWALVGDAACFRDPLTAYGITDALLDAEHVADAMLRGPSALAAYRERREISAAAHLAIADQLASFEWDGERVRALHGDLSRAMKRDLKSVAGLERPVFAAAS